MQNADNLRSINILCKLKFLYGNLYQLRHIITLTYLLKQNILFLGGLVALESCL